jgi:hypothetical protein
MGPLRAVVIQSSTSTTFEQKLQNFQGPVAHWRENKMQNQVCAHAEKCPLHLCASWPISSNQL